MATDAHGVIRPIKHFVNSFNYDPTAAHNFDPQYDDKSMTVPDMALTPLEIYTRFIRQQEIPSLTPVYLGDQPIPDYTQMDELELRDLARSVSRSVEELKNLAENATKARKAKQEALKKEQEAKKATPPPVDPKPDMKQPANS